MNEKEFVIFFIQLSLMLIIALMGGYVARKFKQPSVLGELIGGVILGPTIFGTITPLLFTQVFMVSSNVTIGREAVVKLGLLFFLFIAGLEMRFKNIQHEGRSILGASILGIVFPFMVGFFAVDLFPTIWGQKAIQHHHVFALFLGTALSISALPVIARVLMDIDMIHTKLGAMIMTSAVFNDLVGWMLFAFILKSQIQGQLDLSSVGQSVSSILILFVCMLTIGRWAAQKLLVYVRQHLPGPSGFIGITALFVFVGAAIAQSLGIHAIFGAFLVGIAFSPNSKVRDDTHEELYQLVTNFFAAPLYFVSVGLKVNFITNFDWVLVLVVFVIACVGKVVGVTIGAMLGKLPFKDALVMGFALNARGAMEIILASVALEYHLIDQKVFVALFIMAIATSMLVGPIVKRLVRVSD